MRYGAVTDEMIYNPAVGISVLTDVLYSDDLDAKYDSLDENALLKLQRFQRENSGVLSGTTTMDLGRILIWYSGFFKEDITERHSLHEYTKTTKTIKLKVLDAYRAFFYKKPLGPYTTEKEEMDAKRGYHTGNSGDAGQQCYSVTRPEVLPTYMAMHLSDKGVSYDILELTDYMKNAETYFDTNQQKVGATYNS
jgi:hypothetical protein